MVTIVRKPGPGDAQLKKLIAALGTKVGKVGWFPSAVELDGTPSAAAAATNEFGDPNRRIPPRPFMRPTIEKQRTNWVSVWDSGAKAIINGKETSTTFLEKFVLLVAGQIRTTITQVFTPPLAPYTIAKRLERYKSKTVTAAITKPLIDTGIMYGTLSGVVEEE